MAKPVYTQEQIVANLTRWNAKLVGSEINYALPASRPPGHEGETNWNGFFGYNSERAANLRAALDLISDIIPLTFTKVDDNGQATGQANPRLAYGMTNSAPLFWTAVTYVDDPQGEGVGALYGSDILFNAGRAFGAFDPGSREFMILLHETMHAMGIPHPGEYNRLPDEPILYEKHAEYFQDSIQYTVMSYFGAEETGGVFNGAHALTPMRDDIAVLQSLYGANMTTRAGDTVYGFGSTAGRAVYQFGSGPAPVFSIWDAGGKDRLDAGGYNMAQVINLTPGGFSDIGGLTGNISIGFGVLVEDAVGGSGADKMLGNALANVLTGGGGADWLTGGLGADRFVLRSAGESAVAGADVVWDHEIGVDVLDFTALGAGVRVTTAQVGASTYVYADVQGDGTADALVIAYGRSVAGGDVAVAGGAAGVTMFGDGAANTLTGSARADLFMGGEGADVLRGGKGADLFYGQGGADTYVLAGGDSTLGGMDVSFDFLSGTDKIDVSALTAAGARVTLARFGGSGFLYVDETGDGAADGGFIGYQGLIQGGDLIGAGGLTVYGSAEGDALIRGGAAADVVAGFDGADVIVGGGGADQLYGGAGADTFRYEAVGDSTASVYDFIQDFQAGVDTLDLRALNAPGASKYLLSSFGGSSFVYVDANSDNVVDFLVIAAGAVLSDSDILWT